HRSAMPQDAPDTPSPLDSRGVPVVRVVPVPQWAEPGHRVDETAGASRVLVVGRVMAVLLTVVLLGLIGRVLQLQTQAPPQITERLASQRPAAPLAGRRGTLLDRRGRMLAVTRTARRLFIAAALITERSTASERVGYTLGMDPIEIGKAIGKRSRSRYIVID